MEGNWVTAWSSVDYYDAKLFSVMSGSVVMCLDPGNIRDRLGRRRYVLCADGRPGWVVVEGLRQI